MPAQPASPRPWTVLAHGPLEPLEPNLWRVSGSLPGTIPLKRVMTVARRASGGLVVHNPIALDAAAMTQLDALGAVEILLVPNSQHRLDASSYAVRYPQARVLAPGGGRAKIARLVTVHGTIDDFADPDITLAHVAGTRDAEAMMTVRSGDRTSLVFTDAVFNMPHAHGVFGWVLKHVTQSTGGPKVSRLARLLLIKDPAAFAAQLDQLAAQPIAHVIVSHHDTITDDPAGTLRRIAASLR